MAWSTVRFGPVPTTIIFGDSFRITAIKHLEFHTSISRLPTIRVSITSNDIKIPPENKLNFQKVSDILNLSDTLSGAINTSLSLWSGTACVYFFWAQSKWIPLRIASPFVILFSSQYCRSNLSVSESSLMVKFIPLGLSALGLPVLGDTLSPHFLPCINYNLWKAKSQ